MIKLNFVEVFGRYKKNFFEFNYLFFSIALVIGLSTGEVIMSLASIGLAINWLAEGRFSEKYKVVKTLKYIPYILIAGYFSLFFWLINTSDFEYALHDLKVKLPLLLFPFIFGTIRLSKQFLNLIFRFFILGTLFSTLVSFFVYLELVPIENSLEDVRNISIFISHIRLSLLVCFSVVIIVFFLNKRNPLFHFAISIALLIWFFYFLLILQAITGLFILAVLVVVVLFRLLFSIRTKMIGVISMLFFLITMSLASYHVYTIHKLNFTPKPIDLASIDLSSKSGELYQYDLEDEWLENGNRVWLYIAPKELKESWNKRSSVGLDSIDAKGQPMWGTLYRYLTSKNLRKDKEGLACLTDEEVRLVEHGETNCCEQLTGLDKRIKDVLFQLQRFISGQSPNGHSITQRIEYLKASVDILSSNLVFGVGLGDVHDEFMNYYDDHDSKLIGKNRKRVHNQYMVLAVGIGVVGLSIWIFLIYFPFFKLKQNRVLYFYFLLIVSVSFLTDNTLERQAGVMFFSFFNSLLLFQNVQRVS